ncbi:very short patch repair endonuclease [Lysobacter sp. A421]
MDNVEAKIRSRMMSSIRGKDTQPELIVRRYLHASGFRFRLHRKDLPGRPDLVLPKWRVALFVNGCFWHGHQKCRYFRLPGTRPEFWKAKIQGNRDRDARAEKLLSEQDWRVLTIWECALRDCPEEALQQLSMLIRSSVAAAEIRSEIAHRDSTE